MHRVDITQKAYSKKLADLTDQRSQIVRKIQDRSTWTAAKSAEYSGIVNDDNFCEEKSPLREQARLMSGEVEMRSHEVLEWENELMDLRKEITSTEEYLRWVAESHSKHHQAA
jgi:chromosome segregation ATPase